jgi:hypothetical protein
MAELAEMQTGNSTCPACEELQELCRTCGLCKEFCQCDEAQKDFDSESQIKNSEAA